MRISDWSSDVCSSYLFADQLCRLAGNPVERHLTAIDGLLRQLPGLEETRGPKPDVQAHGKGLRFHVLIMPPDAIARCVEREAETALAHHAVGTDARARPWVSANRLPRGRRDRKSTRLNSSH